MSPGSLPQHRDIRTVDAPPGSEVAVVQAFVRANAQSAVSARSLAALGLAVTPALDGLEARGLLYRASADRWYLDAPRYRARLRRRAAARGAMAAATLLLAWLFAQAL